jgi:hypothetical protein
MSSENISFELADDGELIADSDARGVIVEAMKRAIAKNSDNDRPEAFDPDSGEDDDREEEAELTQAQRAAAERRRLLAALARAGVAPPSATRKGYPMVDTDALVEKIGDDLIEKIRKEGYGLAVVKNFVEEGTFRFSEHQITKILMNHWGADFAKNFAAQTPNGLIARKAVEKARNANWLGI